MIRAIAKLNPKLKLPSDAITVGAPLRWFGNHLQLHRLSLEGERGLERPRFGSGNCRLNGPDRRRRQGQTKACPAISARPRTRSVMSSTPMPSRTKLTYTGDGQQGRQDRAGRPSRPSRPGRLHADWGEGSRLLRDPHRSARREVVAGHRLDLHPDAQGNATDKAASQEAVKFFKWSFQEGAAKMGPKSSTTSRWPESVVKLDRKKTWSADIKS